MLPHSLSSNSKIFKWTKIKLHSKKKKKGGQEKKKKKGGEEGDDQQEIC